MSSKAEIAWAAGVFEGEGCFTIHHGGWKPRKTDGIIPHTPVAIIDMTDRDIIQRFADIVGFGSQRTNDRRDQGYKLSWRWQVSGKENVGKLYTMFKPWLGERRCNRAEEVLAQANPLPPRKRAHCTANGCTAFVVGRGLCAPHYHLARKEAIAHAVWHPKQRGGRLASERAAA